MRLIDADFLKEDLTRFYDGEVTARQLIDEQPTVEDRKKGCWLPDNRPGGGFWVCSKCKFPSEAFAADVLYKFCPNCGADMRGGGE